MTIKHDGVLFDVRLEDDGTLDTVISLEPLSVSGERQEFRYSDTADYRDEDGCMTDEGLQILGHDAAFDYDFGD